MCAGLRLTTETSDLRQIEAELVLEPVDSITGATSQDADEVIPGKLTSLRCILSVCSDVMS